MESNEKGRFQTCPYLHMLEAQADSVTLAND